MKKFIYILSISLLLLFTFNTVAVVAQPKMYSQGFYNMRDLNLSENVSYKVQNNQPYVEGLLIIIDADRKIQQLIRIPANATQIPIAPLKYDYRFIIYNNVLLTFS
ncbi:hypothetical protein [Clostridium beijerinckii]|uniref:hypothetical protein n=1 Tax=Clostridium beijerinckii TaxID=1520 RepID=UPI00156E3018|nr:hypothetical protein [Clostridium beijerinckii]NRT70015.1 hypothetical protein [Clostridium beijerinckii]